MTVIGRLEGNRFGGVTTEGKVMRYDRNNAVVARTKLEESRDAMTCKR